MSDGHSVELVVHVLAQRLMRGMGMCVANDS